VRNSLKHVVLLNSGFNPTQISGLQLWLDSNDSSTLWQDTSATTAAGIGDDVARWDDKSPNSNNVTQDTASKQPALQVGGVQFDGAEYLVSDNSVALTERTIFSVINFNVSLDWDLFTAFDNDAKMYFGKRDTGKLISSHRDSSLVQVVTNGATVISASTYVIMSHRLSVSGSNVDVVDRLNGENDATASHANGLSSETKKIGIGALNISGTLGFGGYMREYILCRTALSDSEISQVESYLSSKWGVALS